MKKIIALLCSALIFVGSAAEAAMIKDDCLYTVKTSAEENEIVTMLVAKKGQSLDDENIVAVREGKAFGGEVVFEFEFENESDYEGEYTIYLMNNQLKTKSEINFTHAADDTIAQAALWIESVTDSERFLEMLGKGSEYRIAFQAMGMKLDYYDNVEEKEAVVSMFLAEKESAENPEELINQCIGAVMINNGYEAEDALICFEPVFENVTFENAEDSNFKAWITDLVGDGGEFAKTSELSDRYNELSILYKFKTAKFSEFSELFETYGKDLEIENESIYKNYMNLSETKKANAGDKLVELQSTQAAQTTEELIDNLQSAYNSINTSNTISSSGGGGGGGNKSSSSNFIAAGTPVENKTETPVKEDEFDGYLDISSASWAETAVNELTKKGIISGDGDGKFRPNDNITREEFTKMLVSALNISEETASTGFADTDKNAWYYPYIASAYVAGIVNGVSPNEFGIKKNITRQEMAAMTARALEKYKEAVYIREDLSFEDGEKIADYAKEAVSVLYRTGIMSGSDNGCFEPENKATRAEAAVVIYNLIK